jgi:hypothetical protein
MRLTSWQAGAQQAAPLRTTQIQALHSRFETGEGRRDAGTLAGRLAHILLVQICQGLLLQIRVILVQRVAQRLLGVRRARNVVE